jgi:hypothetical protein
MPQPEPKLGSTEEWDADLELYISGRIDAWLAEHPEVPPDSKVAAAAARWARELERDAQARLRVREGLPYLRVV